MSNKLPPFHALAAFEAVARHQSFSKAAQELSITQSAISHRINKLEEHLGVQCIVRGRGRVSLTPQGVQLLGGVLDAMSALNAACTRLKNPSLRKTVRLSVGPAFARGWLAEKIGDFYRKHDEIDLEINAVKLSRPGKLAVLQSGEADIAIRYGSESDWPGHKCIKLLHSDAFPVCSPSYAASAGPFNEPCDLVGASLLRLSDHQWTPWFRAAGIACEEPAQGLLFSDAGIMLEAAAGGQGIALARSVLVHLELRTGRLIRLFDTGVKSEFAYHVICPPGAMRRPEVEVFVEWLVSVAGNE
jgi:LysR family transcriptional regulator, glycine cleavage system transcriptional activator